MLSACLRSLQQQTLAATEIVVIDNDPLGGAWRVVRDFIGMRYEHEPKRGIAAARNKALASVKTNWIAFIDDDEVAAPDWLENLMRPEYLNTPVLQGRQELVYPQRVPFWCIATPRRIRPADEGMPRKTAVTNNVRFSTELVRAGLRFDESIGLMGGEDIDFFSLAYADGFDIRFTNLAITYETVHPERITYRHQVYRSFWCAASDIRMYRATRGALWVWSRKWHTILTQTVFGVVEPIRFFQHRCRAKVALPAFLYV
jgi:succinoglycan biosynthesis protein ExoM